MDLELRDKRVLITGASQGIGEGLAEVFAEEGAILHLTARSADKLEPLMQALRVPFRRPRFGSFIPRTPSCRPKPGHRPAPT